MDKASRQQQFNLNYFEFAVALAVKFRKSNEKKYKDLINNIYKKWAESLCYNKDANHPYTISLRLINLAITCSLTKEKDIFEDFFCQYKYLIKHQEKSLLGNHYFENLKTIVICSAIFNERKTLKRYIKKLLTETRKQVLNDGVHFELSPMYHKIVLEGLIRTAYVLKQLSIDDYKCFLPIIDSMLTAIVSLEKGMGKTPSFNDSTDGVAKNTSSIEKAVKRIFNITPSLKDTFKQSGYYKLYSKDVALMFDAGMIGPRFMPGHGHCDCLSFELSLFGLPLFINSGVYQYQGKKRSYYRSTAAHNTVSFDNKEQSECWSEHRVARRVKILDVLGKPNEIIGVCKSYCNVIHKRHITLINNELTIFDVISDKRSGRVRSFLHFAEDYSFDCGCIMKGNKKICMIETINSKYIYHSNDIYSVYSPQFGQEMKTGCIEFFWDSDCEEHGYKIIFNKGEIYD